MTKILTREQIKASNDLVMEFVSCPEWAPAAVDGVTLAEEQRAEYGVNIRNLTGKGRGAFIQKSLEMKKAEDNNRKVDFEIELLLVSMTAVDESGKALYDDLSEGIVEFGARNAVPVSRCAEVATRLSALDKTAKATAEKN